MLPIAQLKAELRSVAKERYVNETCWEGGELFDENVEIMVNKFEKNGANFPLRSQLQDEW